MPGYTDMQQRSMADPKPRLDIARGCVRAIGTYLHILVTCPATPYYGSEPRHDTCVWEQTQASLRLWGAQGSCPLHALCGHHVLPQGNINMSQRPPEAPTILQVGVLATHNFLP